MNDQNPILVVLPVCSEDEELCFMNQTLAHQFGGKHPFACLLVTAQDRPLSNAERLLELLQKTYTGVSRLIIPDRGLKKPWPQPQNTMFLRVCQFMVEDLKGLYDSFFYMESDVTPLRVGWLEDLYASHLSRSPEKRHTGAVVGMPWDAQLHVHMNGVAIYKSDVLYLAPRMVLAVTTPWDIYVADYLYPECNDVSRTLMHHSFRSRKYVGTIKELSYDLEYTKGWKDKKGVIHKEDNVVRKTVDLSGFCVLHGCKDDSLFNILRQKEESVLLCNPEPVSHKSGPALEFKSEPLEGWKESGKVDLAETPKIRKVQAKRKKVKDVTTD